MANLNPMSVVCDLADLERAVGGRSQAALLKSIHALDRHCVTLLSHAPLAVLGYEDGEGTLRAAAVGGSPGFAHPSSPEHLELPLPADAVPGGSAALLVLLPGWPETLRVNGTVTDGGVAVGEAFLHCGRAVVRSELWSAGTGASTAGPGGVGLAGAPLDTAARAFLATSPFAVLVTRDAEGGADASPKGDPAGFVHVTGEATGAAGATVAIPDRPGNRRMDTFHNLVERPEIAVLALTPGDERSLELTGRARITTDEALRAELAERGKTPKAALLVDVEQWTLAHSPAVAAARPWDAARHVRAEDLPRAGQIWADHVKLNDSAGLGARIGRALVNGRLLDASVRMSYKHGLY